MIIKNKLNSVMVARQRKKNCKLTQHMALIHLECEIKKLISNSAQTIRRKEPLLTSYQLVHGSFKPPAWFNLQCNPLKCWPVTLFLGHTNLDTPAVKQSPSCANGIAACLNKAWNESYNGYDTLHTNLWSKKYFKQILTCHPEKSSLTPSAYLVNSHEVLPTTLRDTNLIKIL